LDNPRMAQSAPPVLTGKEQAYALIGFGNQAGH